MPVMKVLSWNIAAGRKSRSTDRFDYEEENLDYFTDLIGQQKPNIICLQETHAQGDDTQGKKISSRLNMDYTLIHAFDTSHIDSSQQIANVIISDKPFTEKSNLELPYNWFGVYVNDNGIEEPAQKKSFQKVKISNFWIANIHTSPLHFFGESYEKGNGKRLAEQIDDFLNQNLEAPLIFCGDFNHDNPEKIFPKTFEALDLHEALPSKPTKPQGTRPDHIYYSKGLKCVKSDVVETESDHFMCWAEIA